MTKDEALTLALEALEGADMIDCDMRDAINAIKEALAQPTSGDYALGYAEGFNDACRPREQPERLVRGARVWPRLFRCTARCHRFLDWFFPRMLLLANPGNRGGLAGRWC